MIAAVVAYDKNRAIGRDNKLPWGYDLPADLMNFKKLTLGQSVVMGRKTYESIGRPLPDRQNIVLSHSADSIAGVTMAVSLEQGYKLAEHEVFIIGGASVFEQAMGDIDIIYATEVQFDFDGTDSYFPRLGPDWHEVSRENHSADSQNKYAFDFVIYQRG